MAVRETPDHAFIYIPVPGSRIASMIDAGSGIVGAPGESHVVLYYEGNRYGASNLEYYPDRVKNAAGRLFQRYPTIAMMGITVEQAAVELVAVGIINKSYEISWDNKVAAFEYGAPGQSPDDEPEHYRYARLMRRR